MYCCTMRTCARGGGNAAGGGRRRAAVCSIGCGGGCGCGGGGGAENGRGRGMCMRHRRVDAAEPARRVGRHEPLVLQEGPVLLGTGDALVDWCPRRRPPLPRARRAIGVPVAARAVARLRHDERVAVVVCWRLGRGCRRFPAAARGRAVEGEHRQPLVEGRPTTPWVGGGCGCGCALGARPKRRGGGKRPWRRGKAVSQASVLCMHACMHVGM